LETRRKTGDSSQLESPIPMCWVLFCWRSWLARLVSGQHREQLAVGQNAEFFRPVAEVAQAFTRKNFRPGRGVDEFQIVKADQDRAVSKLRLFRMSYNWGVPSGLGGGACVVAPKDWSV
jgi:hypothetical protein